VALVEVLSVARPEAGDELAGFSIDTPTAETQAGVFALYIAGWAQGRKSPVVAVEILHDRRPIRRVPARPRRGDAASGDAPEPRPVFHALVGVLGLPPEFELGLTAVLEDDTRVPIGTIRARHEPVRPPVEPTLQPIVLSGLIRSGTTLLMRLLDSHPRVVVGRPHPFESGTARYWVHMLRVLSEPGNLTQSSKPKSFQQDLWKIGQNPFYDRHVMARPELGDWLGRTYVERLAAFCVSSIDGWYTRLAGAQGKDDPVYFAEKDMLPSYLPVLMRELYPEGTEVFLVRDFRDTLCSVIDRGMSSTREEGARWVRGMASNLHESWKTRGEGAHLLHYEDLVRRPLETLRTLYDHLALDASDAELRRMLEKATEETPQLRGHRTSTDSNASIGRWKREGDASFRALCEEALGEVSRAFGYPD
jgi:sulfotransferase family protein